MVTLNQKGSLNALLIPLIAVSLLLVAAGGFAFWAFSGRQDYKNNVDTKVTAAVTAAVQKEDAKKDAQFAEKEKNPFKTYSGPSAFGSLQVMFPKTWSAYVNENPNGGSSVDGYFNPGFVPDLQAQSSAFALRIRVVNLSYSAVMQQFSPLIAGKTATASPYALPKVPSVIGTRLDGQLVPNKQESMVVLPLRANTLEIWTESPQFVPDLNNNILPNLSFSP